MTDKITMNTEAFNAMIEDARRDGYDQAVSDITNMLNRCMFVEQGVTVYGDDISLYLMQQLKDKNNE
jgi:virulence-associated protein VapD